MVIPVDFIDHQTKTAVFLERTGRRFEDFDPARFAVPDDNWRPPYPYRHDHVLLDHPVEAGPGNSQVIRVNQDRQAIA